MTAATVSPETGVVPSPPVGRMAIAVLALIGLLIAAYLSLHALGLLPEVVCGTGSCARVQNSPWAVFFGVPVPFIGFFGYAALLVLAIAGAQPQHVDSRTIALLLLGGASVGLLFSAYLTYLEAAVINAWCRWCVASAVVATLIFIFALSELRVLRRNT